MDRTTEAQEIRDEDLSVVCMRIEQSEARIRQLIAKCARRGVLEQELDWMYALQARRRQIIHHRYDQVMARQLEGAS